MKLDESLRKILNRVDNNKTIDNPDGNPFLPNNLSIDEALAKIKALVVESIPPNVENPTSSATEPYTVDEVFRVSRNLTLGEIRSIWE